MKIKIRQYNNNQYYLSFNNNTSALANSSCLKINIDKYISILKKYNAINAFPIMYFNSKNDAEQALHKLMPYIVAEQLRN